MSFALAVLLGLLRLNLSSLSQAIRFIKRFIPSQGLTLITSYVNQLALHMGSTLVTSYVIQFALHMGSTLITSYVIQFALLTGYSSLPYAHHR